MMFATVEQLQSWICDFESFFPPWIEMVFIYFQSWICDFESFFSQPRCRPAPQRHDPPHRGRRLRFPRHSG